MSEKCPQANFQDIAKILESEPEVKKAWHLAWKRRRQYVAASDAFNTLLSAKMKERAETQRKSASDFMKMLDYDEFLPDAPSGASSSAASSGAPVPGQVEPSEPAWKWRRVEVGPSGQLYSCEVTESESETGSD